MPISMRCPGCKTHFEFANDLEGKRIKCKTCGDIFRVEKPTAKAKDNDDRPAVKSASRKRDDADDERPKATMASSAFRNRDDDDDDRPSSRSRRADDDDDDDRPPSRTRRPVDDDDDDRRSGYRRRSVDEDDDDRPRRRRDEDDDDEPPKKKSPLLLFGLLAGGLAILLGAGALIFVLAKKSKDGPGGVGGDVVKAPTKSCPLEVAEKDAGTLVLPDSGNVFGLLRKGDTLKKAWTFDLYDMGAGRRIGRLDITDMDEPRSVSLSPDGKHFLAMEAPGFGNSDPTIRLWNIPENKLLTQQKWNPYPHKGGFDPPNLYRAEFIANDKILTISAARFFDVFTIPSFERPIDPVRVNAVAKAEVLGKDDRSGQVTTDKYQRQVAFSADRKLMAVWNGDGFTVVSTGDGQDVSSTTSVQALVKEFWPRQSFLDRVKGGPIAFSPDGKVLAGIITHDFHPKKHILCLWDVKDPKPPAAYEIPANQFNDSPSIHWWGNRYIVTHGAKVEGMLIDKNTGLAKRQLMGPHYGRYGFGRDGRLWYVAGEEIKDPAVMHVVDVIDPEQLTEGDDYEQIVQLNEEFFLRRLWLEPGGVRRKPSRLDPPLQQRLIRRP